MPFSLSGMIWCLTSHVWFTDIITLLTSCVKVTTFLVANLAAAVQLFSVQLCHSTFDCKITHTPFTWRGTPVLCTPKVMWPGQLITSERAACVCVCVCVCVCACVRVCVCVCQLTRLLLKYWLDELDSSLTAQAHALRAHEMRLCQKALHPSLSPTRIFQQLMLNRQLLQSLGGSFTSELVNPVAVKSYISQ